MWTLAMLSLSTVGHAMVTSTYWYLQAVPELMAVAAQPRVVHAGAQPWVKRASAEWALRQLPGAGAQFFTGTWSRSLNPRTGPATVTR